MLVFLGGLVGLLAELLTYDDGQLMEVKINYLNVAQANIWHLIVQQTHAGRSQLEELHKIAQAQYAYQMQLLHELRISVQLFNEISNAMFDIRYTQNFGKVLYAIDTNLDK